MNDYETYSDDRPLTWIRGYPLYAAHMIVVGFVVSLFATVFLHLFNLDGFTEALVFSSPLVLRGEVWRVITYGLVNSPSLWFVIDMAMIIWFGREVERSFGRRRFLIFFAGLYLLTPVLLTLIGVWRPTSFAGETGSFGLFIAFAVLFPNAVFFFNLLAKWIAVILVAIYTLIALNNRDPIALASLWLSTGFAFAFVRFEQGRWHLSLPRLFRRGPRLQVLPGGVGSNAREEKMASLSEVDALLDKIAQSGLSSLTAKERARLDAARQDLLRREAGRHR